MSDENLPQVHLVRHGETAWSLSGQATGRTNIPLTKRGERDARELGMRWSPASGQFAKLAANEDEDEQRGWQTEELQRRVQGEGGA